MIKASSQYTPRSSSGQFVAVKILPGLMAGVNEFNKQVYTISQSKVPEDSGELKGSGEVVPAADTGKTIVGGVRYTANHAGFVEFGTGVRGAGTYPGTLPTSGVPITGSWIYDYKKQNWVGHAAQPYMRPAFDEMKPQAKDVLKDAISVTIT